MKIDHLVINVNQEYQLNNNIIEEIRRSGFPMNLNGERVQRDLKRPIYGLEMNT